MGAFIAGFTMNRGQFLAAGFHGLMELRLIGSARAPMEPYGNPHRPPSHISKTVLSTVHVGGPSGQFNGSGTGGGPGVRPVIIAGSSRRWPGINCPGIT